MLVVEDVCFNMFEKCTKYLFFRNRIVELAKREIRVALELEIKTLRVRAVLCHARFKHRRFSNQPTEHAYRQDENNSNDDATRCHRLGGSVIMCLSFADFKASQYMPHSNA